MISILLRLTFILPIVSLVSPPLPAESHGIHIGSELEDQQISNAPSVPQTGPHGGSIGNIENYRFELLMQGEDTLRVYLYNKDLKPVSANGKEGLLYLQLPDAVKVTLQLKPVAEKKDSTAHFEGRIDMTDIDSFNAVVSLKIDNKRHNLRFSWSKVTTGQNPERRKEK